MRILLISDIHGNLEALESCFRAADKEKIDKINVLGDIVGYMANPNECVEMVLKYDCIYGNHDAAVFRDDELMYFNPYAGRAILWTREQLEQDYINFLSTLPNRRVYMEHGYTIAHGSLGNPLEYIENEYQVEHNVELSTTDLVFVGHTRIPVIWSAAKGNDAEKGTSFMIKNVPLEFEKDIQLERNKKYIINIGSVGQPRDRNPKGCCVIYDTEKYTIKYLRFAYAVQRTVEKIIANNLPEFLHIRLLRGE